MYYWSFWGMHFFWWIFWIALIALFFSLATPVRRSQARLFEDPLAILRRRYAAGEISTEEYNERKVQLEKDALVRTSGTSSKATRIDRHQPA